jgi:hypothetical protein
MFTLSLTTSSAQIVNSQSDLENFLSRAVTASSLRDIYNERTAYEASIAKLTQIDAKFIGRITGIWTGESIVNQTWFFPSISTVITDINRSYDARNQSRPICQAGIFEVISTEVNNVPIPQYVWEKFNTSVFRQRNFDFNLFRYDYGHLHNYWSGDPQFAVPDMSKTETKMWFYFLATQYIDAGIKSIHFGQVGLMDHNDPGCIHWWDLLSKVRAYATHNNTFVLCDAHTTDRYFNINEKLRVNGIIRSALRANLTYLSFNNINDPSFFDAERSNMQLLFDFHSGPIRPHETVNRNGAMECNIDPNFAANGVYRRSKGGISPRLGAYAKVPYIVEFDNHTPNCGAAGASTPEPENDWCVWGFDEITWFKNQNRTYQDQFIKYAYCAVNAIDGNGFLQFSALRMGTGNEPPFNALLNSQSDIFKAMWDSYKSTPSTTITIVCTQKVRFEARSCVKKCICVIFAV